MSDIPDGAGINVAAMAIAWEMSVKIVSIEGFDGSAEELMKWWLKLYEEAFKKVKELAIE